MKSELPTLVSSSWTVAGLRDSLRETLLADDEGRDLKLYFYAVTQSGWKEIRDVLMRWHARAPVRRIAAYVGTDHGITEPDAIRQMAADGVSVAVLQDYSGIFHPKVVWLSAPGKNLLWIGSNNLTRDGLLQNIEFASLIVSAKCPLRLKRWARAVHQSSVGFSEDLIADYEAERRLYGIGRATLGTFTWSRREKQSSAARRNSSPRRRTVSPQTDAKGSLVVEIMPRETGQDGKQIQLPIRVARTFFGFGGRVGETRRVLLVPEWIDDPRVLTMTVFRNHTIRLVIKELDYGDRPCVLLFRQTSESRYEFDIVCRAISPARYRRLLLCCGAPTRSGSRRWGLT